MTTAILSVIALAVYSSLASSLRIWKRVNVGSAYEDLVLFLDRFARDLTNCLLFTGIAFRGNEKTVEFASFVQSPHWGGNVVGRVSYLYDPQTKNLERIQQDFSQIYAGGELSKSQSLAGLESLQFRYYVYDEETKEYFWKDELSEGDLPAAVRVELELKDGNQTKKFVRTVSIPIIG